MKSTKSTDRGWWRGHARTAVSVGASLVAIGGLGAASAAAATTPKIVSFTTPSRVIQSQGNLYWTQNVYNPSSATPFESFVWRAAKTNVPGHEILLFSQYSSAPASFGDIAYAQVGGNWFGYVVANYPNSGISRILRIPLTPTTSAYILKDKLPMIGQNDLVTDGTDLYWADAGRVREMPIAGGLLTNLATGTNFAHVVLDATEVIYTASNQVDVVSKSGGLPRAIGRTGAGVSVSALSLAGPGTDHPFDTLVYGETNGSVFEVGNYGGTWGTPGQQEGARPGVTITSVTATNGQWQWPAWGECSATGCDINWFGAATPTGGVPVDLQLDGGSFTFFWGGQDLFSMQVPVPIP